MRPPAGTSRRPNETGLIGALAGLIDAGRIKVYSIDSVAGQHWLSRQHTPEYCSKVQNLFDAYVYEEIVPLVRHDCASQDIELIATGASIGAFNAVATLCRHPDAFRVALGMSGTYDLSGYLHGHWSDDFYFSSPMHFLPGLSGWQLDRLRRPHGDPRVRRGSLGGHRRVLAHGACARRQGRAEPGRPVGHELRSRLANLA